MPRKAAGPAAPKKLKKDTPPSKSTVMAEAAHAVLSASGSELWLVCAGSAWLQARFPDDPSEPAEEGTFAHALAAARLKHWLAGLSGVSQEEIDHLATPEAAKYYNAEMDEHVNGYVRRCIIDIGKAREIDPNCVVMVERRLDYSRWVPQGFGTGDLVIVINGSFIWVRDLKYGKGVYVEVEDNSQLKLYALGAYAGLSMLYDITGARCVIDQPRRGGEREMELPIVELLDWAENYVKPRGHKAWRIFTNEEAPEYTPGSHCTEKFCRARHECHARADAALKTLAQRPTTGALSTDEIAALLPSLKPAIKWATELLEYAEREAIEGRRVWPGQKLVMGRSNRYVADPDGLAARLMVEGFPKALLYQAPSLIGLGELEKLVGAKLLAAIAPEGSIKKPEGKPALVSESDPRPQWKPRADAEDEFSDEAV